MPEFHIHVYRVHGKFELDLDAPDAEVAREKALKLVKQNEVLMSPPDTDFVAISFPKDIAAGTPLSQLETADGDAQGGGAD